MYSSPVAPGSTFIDKSGRFRIPDDRARLIRVTVSVPGFAPYEFRLTVPAASMLRLPPIHLEPPTYFRVRFASRTGEPLTSPVIRHRSFDGSGAPIPDEPDASLIEVDADGATRIGPLPHGLTAMALDMPTLAQMRIPNVSVTGADPILDGGTIIVQSGSTLHVDLSMRRDYRCEASSSCSKTCCRGPLAGSTRLVNWLSGPSDMQGIPG